MKVLRRLYRYLRSYKGWAIVAFGSMIIFAATQTMLMGLIRPLFDEVLSPPKVQRTVQKLDPTKQRMLDAVLNRDMPEGQRGWFINGVDRVTKSVDVWWNAKAVAWPPAERCD